MTTSPNPPPPFSVIARLRSFFAARATGPRRTRVDLVTVPAPNVATGMDVDRVGRALLAAEGGDMAEWLTLCRDIVGGDAHIQAELGKRKLALLRHPATVFPAAKDDAAAVRAADFVRGQVEGCASFLPACNHLLDSVLMPVAVVEKVFAPGPGGVGFVLRELVPVPWELLDFTAGAVRLRETDAAGRVTGQVVSLDPVRYIVHRGHLLTAPDTQGGPMRALVYWWLLGNMSREWWAGFLERFGAPFLVGRYDSGDDRSRSVLMRAFEFATRIGGLVVSRETDVEVKQASGDGGGGFERFLDVAQKEMSKLIIGQTASASGGSNGLNSGANQQAEAVRSDIAAFDSLWLGRTLEHELFAPLLEFNGFRGRAPKVKWGAEDAVDLDKLSSAVQRLFAAGIEPADGALDELSSRFGFALRRVAAPAAPAAVAPALFAPSLRAAERAPGALDGLAREAAPELARVLGEAAAGLGRRVRGAMSADDLLREIGALEPETGRAASLLQETFNAAAIYADRK